jgi:hypothetical protein
MIYVMDDANNLILFNFTQGSWNFVQTSQTNLHNFEKVYDIALIDVDKTKTEKNPWYTMLIIGGPIVAFLGVVIAVLVIR